ncbi:hypothetical protein BDZ89DRAFT_1162596 [Hymenopellis radicata]|nr:hypothetical protein BDZ89DRAFT_1162596 [Hymenopellis radicata]
MSKQQDTLPRSAPDVWTSEPFTIKSTFVWETVGTDAALRTESCGFGWHFVIDVSTGPSSMGEDFPATDFISSFSFTPPTGNASGAMRTGVSVSGTAAMRFNDQYTRNVAFGFCAPSLSVCNSICDRIGTCSVHVQGVQTITFTFDVSFVEGAPLRDATSPSVLTAQAKDALARTIESGELVDVKFYLFTSVRPDGTVCYPKSLYGSRTVIHQVSHFLDSLILRDDFSESQVVDLDGEWDVERFVDNYNYHEDSDLEELGEEEPQMNGSLSPANGHLYDDGEFPKHQMTTPRRMGRICQPKNIAYKTFKSLLVYLYTQEITLAPLKSTESARKGKDTASTLSSPKSMYRLADMIDLPALKERCLQAIHEGLTTDNIYEELFSKFTSLYPEVLQVELEFAVDHWAESENQRRMAIAKCIAGDYPHSTFALTSLVARLSPSGLRTVQPPKSNTADSPKAADESIPAALDGLNNQIAAALTNINSAGRRRGGRRF